jgi:hypothetical protein
VVECDLAKVEVAGSNPVSRSRFLKGCRQNKVTALNHEGCESTGSLGCTPFHGRLKRLTSNRYNELLQKQGAVPKWLRERSAKPLCVGSIPTRASKLFSDLPSQTDRLRKSL